MDPRRDVDLTRRQLLAGAVGGGTAVGGGVAIYNVFLGYDRFTGTNLQRQDLDPLMAEYLSPSGERIASVDGYRLVQGDGIVSIADGDDILASVDASSDSPETAAAIDEEYGLSDGPLEQLVADLYAVDAGDVRFVYESYPAFFERLETADGRPYTVSALRGSRRADPDVVAEFSGVDPREPKSVAEGLVDGFREHTNYDVPRYVAGSVEDNVLFGARDLRNRFESPTDFQSLVDGEDTGIFCYELTRRSVEALQSVPATEQTTPVFAGYVVDDRHKHVYTVVASAIRDDGELVFPVTFLDYTHSTLYDDLRIRRLTGEGLDAYDNRHKATSIAWYR